MNKYCRQLAQVLCVMFAVSPHAYSEADAPAGMEKLVGAVNATDDLQPFLIVTLNGIWPTHNVEVCWEGDSGVFPNEKALVRAGVSAFIEVNSEYRFGKSWGHCDTDQRPRIRIEIADAGPRSDVGYQTTPGALFGPPSGLPTFMRLNFVFANWGTDKCAKSEATKHECIRTIAIHEFLHALGAIHEHLSVDLKERDPECWKLYAGIPDVHPTDATPLTDYDPDSIMNYCRDIYDGSTRLSKRDLKGLKELSTRTAKKLQQ